MLIDFGEACETLMPTYGAGNALNRPPEIINAVSVRACSCSACLPVALFTMQATRTVR